MKRPSAKRRTEIATLGGHARAKQLSARRRQQIARQAAQARWAKRLPKSVHRVANNIYFLSEKGISSHPSLRGNVE